MELQFHPDPAAAARKLSTNLYDIPLLSVQWITPDDGQKNCPKHLEFHSKINLRKLMHLVGFIIRKVWTVNPNVTSFSPWLSLLCECERYGGEQHGVLTVIVCTFVIEWSIETVWRLTPRVRHWGWPRPLWHTAVQDLTQCILCKHLRCLSFIVTVFTLM
jgi:hypothetical protein